MLYAQSAVTDILGRDTFCHHTVNVKNVHVLKLAYINRLKKCVTDKQPKTWETLNSVKSIDLLQKVENPFLIFLGIIHVETEL